MKTRQYEHIEEIENEKANKNTYHIFMERFPYKDREVLIRHLTKSKENPCEEHKIVVLGYINGEFRKQKKGREYAVTDIKPITEELERGELSDFLGNVTFWD